MASNPADALRDQISAGTVVAVVGTGVSVAASGGLPTASWFGLLESGIERAANFGSALPQDWKQHCISELSYAKDNAYLPGVLSVAQQITDALGSSAGGEFKSWLRDDIGSLKLNQSGAGLIKAIGNLNVPITTTNYDTLIEAGLERSTTTWRDSSSAQLVIQGSIDNILHLHGAWDQAESIVFGSFSYGQLSGSTPAMALQKVLAAGRSLLFIGCGTGLLDPNFESLRQWLANTFPSSELRHYRLCVESEVGQLTGESVADRIIPVPYAASYDALPGFLHALAPPNQIAVHEPRSCLTIQQRAADAINDRVRADSVMAEYMPDVDARALNDILIPPVLLPVTPDQFAQSATIEKELRPKRCDPEADVRDNRLILVAAQELSGLTSALQWMVLEANRIDPSLTPVAVDFRQLGSGHNPLERQVRKTLRLSGVDLQPDEALPRIALALDNLAPRPEKIFSRCLNELKGDQYEFIIMGCRQGSEAAIVEHLESTSSPTLRYVGRLNSRDATKMAELIEPARAAKIATKAIAIAKSEHLPRTPLTIGLLLCMLLHGDASMLTAASPTALLDAWVNLLLGRGDPHEDARFALDSLEKGNILAFMAQRFVEDRTGSFSEATALGCLEDYFVSVGWTEDPIEVLDNFKKRYLLNVSNGQVRFAQSSYLHLFAAKRAIEWRPFRKLLCDEPLYFSPILRHYAALTRNDVEMLQEVERLLTPTSSSLSSPRGSSFSDVRDGDGIVTTSIEDLMRQLSLSGDAEQRRTARGEVGDDAFDTWLDHDDDSDHEPFPLYDIEDAEPIVQVIVALTLVSNVLRDSELVKDLGLKTRVLSRALEVWGKLVDLLDVNDDFREFWHNVAKEFAELLEVPEGRRSKFIEEFRDMAPLLVGFTGVSATLSSRKLLLSLASCFGDDTDFIADPGGMVMGSFMAFDLHEPGWPRYFLDVQAKHGRIKALWALLVPIAEKAYYEEDLSQDSDLLLDFLVRHNSQRVPALNPADRKKHENKIRQQLRRNRLVVKSRAAVSSVPVIRMEIDPPGTSGLPSR